MACSGESRAEALGEHGPAALALWRARLVLMVMSTVWIVGTMGLAAVVLLGVGVSGPSADVRMLSEFAVAMGILLAVMVPALLMGFVDWIVVDLAAPVMMVTGTSAMGALRAIRDAERFEMGELLLYVLGRMVIAFGVALFRFPLMVLCCCVFMIPGVYHAVFLPILVFQRGTSMQWLSGLDDAFVALAGASLEPAMETPAE